MALMPRGEPVSVPDPMADDWDEMARQNRVLQAHNDPLADHLQGGGSGAHPGVSRTETPAHRRLGERRHGAGPLLELISRREGGAGEGGYDTIYGDNYYAPIGNRRLSDMTLDEVAQLQDEMRRRGRGSTAVGKYQFLKGSLAELKPQLGLKGSERFTPELQDELAMQTLYGKRGYGEFLAGRLSKDDFQKALAQEWRSLPVGPEGYAYSKPGAPRVKAQVSHDDLRKALDEALAAEAALDAQLDGGYSPP